MYNLYSQDTAYRIYISDVLRMIAGSTAALGGGEFSAPRFADFILDDHRKKDPRTGDQIISDIMARLRGDDNEPV